MNQINNIIKQIPKERIQKIMNKNEINNLTDSQITQIINKFDRGNLTIDEKNQLLIGIISEQIYSGSQQYVNGFSIRNACPFCQGKGFNVHIELEKTNKCPGTKDCLSCNGTGIMTKICLRCDGQTLNEILRKRELLNKNRHIPGMSREEEKKFREKFKHYILIDVRRIHSNFIKENAHRTFRVIQADNDNRTKYSYIQKNPCRACSGTGRFEYKNAERTIKCPGCHGKGQIRTYLKTTNRIKNVILCNKCGGSGRTYENNPVINLQTMPKKTKKALEERGLVLK